MDFLKITSYEVEKIKDPTGIITGDRYEFLLGIEVPEDDELFDEDSSLDLRVILAVVETEERIVQYHFLNRSNGKVLDFGLEEEEEVEVLAFCKEHYNEAI
ncbi:DUF6509 family protein [Psychrobacillus sp. NPDC093180]|uniref:DUF6509 family protein n=1 Tax=Psychrobacillus sp. NPDC093180 TaxID=3364489 RepID=UPI003812FF64